MRIAVFLTSYQIGGVEKVFFTLLNEWAKLGHNVYAYVLRNEGEFNRDVDARVSIINLNCNNLWKSCFKVSKLLRQHKIEYFMVGKDIENMFFIAMKMLTRCRCKVIISQHNYFYQKNKDRKSLREGFIYLLMKLLYRHSDFIICVAKGIEQYVMTLNVEKNQTAVIYNPIDIETVEEGSKKFIIESGNFVSFCGRLSPIKNIDLLINGFEIFLREYPDYKLLLIGGGTEERHLKQLVKEKKLDSYVFFIGSVPNPHCYVARSQALVLSSYSEAFPMVICEAFVTGTTVVSTPSGGPNELLENGRGYLLKSFQDAEEMAKTIAYACEHPIDTQLLKNYVRRFDISKVAQQYIDILQNIMLFLFKIQHD